MSKGSAIIARMGLDLNGLRGDLSAAEKLAVRAANRMQGELNNATKGRNGKGTGHGGGSGAAARPFGDAINLATGTSGAVNEVGMLSHWVGGAAAAAGIVVVAKAAEKLSHALLEVQEANEGAKKVLGQKTHAWWESLPLIPEDFKKGDQIGKQAAEGIAEMTKRRQELAAESERLEKSRTFASAIGGAVLFGANNPKNPVNTSLKLQQQIDEERLILSARIAGKVREETAAREMMANHSQREGEVALLRLQTEQKIANLRDDKSLGPDQRKALIDQARAEAAIHERDIDHRADALEREIGLTQRLTYIRLQGDQESVKAAYARTEAAKDELQAARTDEEKAAARAKIEAAELEYQLAQKAWDAQQRSDASAIAIAGLRADADTKHLAALIAEDRLIQARQNDPRTTADEQRKLAVEAARNAAAQREHNFSATGRAFDIGGSLIDAGQGVGQAEAMRAAREKLALERARLTHLQNSPEAGPGDIAAQQAKVADMARSYADAAFNLALGNREAKGQTVEMALQLQHQDSLGAAVREQLDYAERIRQAQRDGNTELAAQLETQKQLARQVAARNAAEAEQERNGLTLGQLAGMGGSAGSTARRVQRLESRATRLRGAGRIEEADKLMKQANDLRLDLTKGRPVKEQKSWEEIFGSKAANPRTGWKTAKDAADGVRNNPNRPGILKPSEAERDNLKTALDSSKVLADIKTNTDMLGVNL